MTDTAKRKKEVVAADIPAMATYGPCVRAGEFLLPSGLMPVAADGTVAGRTLSPGFAALAHADSTQAALVYAYAEALCGAGGTAMENLVRAQYFVSDPVAFPGIQMAWTTRFGARPHPFICIRTPPEMPAPGMNLIADFWIFVA